ncbi:MAG: TetR/AcrR family transcriptional regulator [bacterium]|nr:TetR/AcrR family transcriptional regulator [bacterium]
MSTTGAEGKETPKRSRRGEETRERIIEAAKSLIARHGPDGFQLQNVTAIPRITPPAIYNHFKDRDDLVTQIAEKGGHMF